MLTLNFYMEAGDDAATIIAAAMMADMNDHAMAGACITLAELAAQQDATGHALEAAVMRRASRWLQTEVAEHRRVVDELLYRAGEGRLALALALKERRAAMVATRQAAAPLFAMTRRYLHLALSRAALDEADELLKSDDPASVVVAAAVLEFMKLNQEPIVEQPTAPKADATEAADVG